jgi:DNA mismatch repair ATPase MutL
MNKEFSPEERLLHLIKGFKSRHDQGPADDDSDKPASKPGPAANPEKNPETGTEKNPETGTEKNPETNPERNPETGTEKNPETSPEKNAETSTKKNPETSTAKTPETRPEKPRGIEQNIGMAPVKEKEQDLSQGPANASAGYKQKQGFSEIQRKNVASKPMVAGKDILVVFIVAFVLFGGYIIFDVLINKDSKEAEDIRSLIASISDSEKYLVDLPTEEPVLEADLKKQEKPASSLEDYQRLIGEKAVFSVSAADAQQRSPAVLEGMNARDILKEFRLVGVMPGDPPQAIIEDIKNKQTLFVKEGEMIDSIQVKQILTGRVMLGYNEEIITLSL